MKRAIFIVFFFATAGVAASLYMIPGAGELALISFKDKKFDEARLAYEQQMQEGKLTPEVVNTLVDLELQQGDVNKAVEVMEAYLAVNPADISARKRLGQLYQFAQRPDDYLRNLEQINLLEPTPETMNELSQIYNSRADYAKQAEALKALIESEQGTDASRYMDLANILAAGKSRDGAINALTQLKTKHPEKFGFREAELLTSLLLDEKRYNEALALGQEWKAAGKPGAEVARLINLMHYKGAPEMAAQLMASYEDAAIDADSALLEQKILLMITEGKEADAYQRLQALHEQGALTVELQNRLLFMAIAREDDALASELSTNMDVRGLNESQAIGLLELAITRGDTKLKGRLVEAFDNADYHASYPMLAALIGYATKASDREERFAALEPLALQPGQLVQGARVCIRMREMKCADTLLTRMPQPDQLSDGDALSVANLYFDIGAYDKGYAFISHVAAERTSPAIEETKVRFAAVRGDMETVEAWLNANESTARMRTLMDLFFAARNKGHHALASRIAERAYAREETAETRSMLAASYVSGKQYAKAVDLLRGASELSAIDEASYLTALTQLAKKNPEYRRELGAYAAARLNSNVPYERKMNLIYALVNAGQIEVAMPHIRTLALKNGGKWAWLYASELTKQGKHEEARQFWVQLAGQSNITDKERTTIAFNLLQGGYVNDAEPIFRRVAERHTVGTEQVNQLLYVWGPRINDSQMEWLAKRYTQANSAAEKNEWGKVLSSRAAPEQLVPFIENEHPEMLYSPAMLGAYVTALGQRGELAGKHAAIFRGVAETQDVALVKAYAEAAEGQGFTRGARDAYELLWQNGVADAPTLRKLGVIAANQAEYSASRNYLTSYFTEGMAKQDTPIGAATASYFYAETLRRAKDDKAAAEYYRKTIATVEELDLRSAEALSLRAQSLAWLGQKDQALAAFDEAVQRYPDNDTLKADRINTLIEMKRYSAAFDALEEPITRLNGGEVAAMSLPVPEGVIEEATPYAGGNQVVLKFSGSDREMQNFAAEAQQVPWVNYTSEGYKRVMVAAKPGYQMQLTKDAMGRQALVAMPAQDSTGANLQLLRYHLLAARAEMETAQVYNATKRLNTLMEHYPNNSQLLGFTANAENYGGNWARAEVLLKTARTLAPENEDIRLLERDIRRFDAPNVTLDHEWVKRGNDRENITTLKGFARVTDNLDVGAVLQNNKVKAKNMQRADGRIGNFSDNQQRMELFVRYFTENGQRIKGSLYANNDTPGAGLTYEFLNPLGESGIGAEYHRPYWDYVEGVLDEATRDRISVWHVVKPSSRLSVRIEPGFNRYNTSFKDNVARTFSLDARVVYRPIENRPYLYLGYGFSGEYMLHKEFGTNVLGNAYRRLPVETREIHFLSVTTGHEFSAQTYGDLMLGYGWDRFGGHGPLVEGRLTHEINEMLDAQIRASYGLDTKSSNNDITRIGGYLRARF